ncbi:MAG: TonB-dependent receptor [Tannerellaceae bacterium]|jgi:outer membrane receptor protein involved in Fe transport|nr:TonB-dependent receptor [Tannerellaceae bacterium]
MKRTLFRLILLTICVINPLITVTAQIRGQVQEENTGNPVDFADIILMDKDSVAVMAHTYSDSAGYFRLSGVKSGEYSLTVRLIGYENVSLNAVTVNSPSAVADVGVIRLKPLGIELSEVSVEGSRRQIIYKLDKRIIDASNNLMGSGGTAVDILENTPSVRVGADGDVTFRGSGGFKVYIDGKPSFYSGTQALQQIPAGQIENIEIITIPSARHDTDGEVGMINIITKKRAAGQGIDGIVNLYGSTALAGGADFQMLQQRDRWQWHLAGRWNQPVRESDFTQQKETRVNGLLTTSASDGLRRSKNHNYGLTGGVDYSFTPMTTAGVEAQIAYDKSTRTGDLNYTETISGPGETLPATANNYNSIDNYDLHATVGTGKAGFSHKFNDRGHQLTASVMAVYEGGALEYFQSDLFSRDGRREQGHRAWEDEIRWTVRTNLDYVLPYSTTGRFEGGYQYHSYLEDGDYSMQFWNPAKQEFYWRDDIYNTFYFQRGIHSVYLVEADSYKALEAQIGLRGEHTHQVLRSSIRGADRTVNRFEIFPSLHLGFSLPDEQKITLAYSYRTNRPQLFYMEPYITYRDYYTAETGNPDIKPEYVHSYELSYKKNPIQASLFYRSRTDKVERLRVPYEAGVTLDSMANVGDDHSAGMEFGLQMSLGKWWDLNVNGNIYYYKVINHIFSGGKRETSTNYDFTINNLFRLHRNTRIQLDGNFVGPSVTTQGRSESFWFINLAIRQQLFTPDLQSTLSFRDVFNSARYRSNITTADLVSVTNIRPSYPVIMLSLSYTFNNYKRSSQQSRDNRDLFEGKNY